LLSMNLLYPNRIGLVGSRPQPAQPTRAFSHEPVIDLD
jgi:hypothetical protein